MAKKQASKEELTTKRSVYHKVAGHAGLYYTESPKNRISGRPLRCWVIRTSYQGKPIKETFGWENEEGKSLEDAIKRLGELRKGAVTKNEQKIALSKAMTLNEFWDQTYKPHFENDPSCRKFFRHQAYRYEKYYRSTIGSLKLEMITRKDVELFWRDLNAMELSMSTKVQVMSIFRQMVNYAEDLDVITGKSPFKGFKMPTVGKTNRRIQWFRQEQAAEILKAAANPPQAYSTLRLDPKDLHDAIYLSLLTGMRAGEIVKLRVIDFKKDTSSLQLLDTKNGETEEIKLPEQIAAMLEKRTEGERKPGDLLFPSFNGNYKNLSDRFRDLLERLEYNAGIEDIRQRYCFHTLRHTYISWLVVKGIDLTRVQRLARHKTIEMTMRYAKLREEHLWEAVNTMNGVFTLPKQECATAESMS